MPGSIASIVSLAMVASAFLADDGPPPGWAARFTSGSSVEPGPEPVAVVTTHAEHAAFALAEGETLHPEIRGDGCHATYAGDLRVARKGRYGFTLEVEGGVARLRVASESGAALGEVTCGAAPGKPAERRTLERLELAPATLRLTIEFTRFGGGAARLRTLWMMEPDAGSSGFAEEPIAAGAVRVPRADATAVLADLAARRGRAQLTELGCVSCHSAGERGAFAAAERGPIALDRVAARAGSKWLTMWMAAPQFLKPGAGMPGLLESKEDVYALLELLESQVRDANGQLLDANGQPVPPTEATPPADGKPAERKPFDDPPVDPDLAARGSELFHEVGCVGCHGPLEPAKDAAGVASGAEPAAFVAPAPFGNLKQKWRLGELAAFLRDPRATRTHGRMPSLGLDEREAAALAHDLVGRFGAPEPPVLVRALAPARVELGRRLFVERGCASCHSINRGDAANGVAGNGVAGNGISAAPAGAKPIADFASGDLDRGCLAASDDARGKAPIYQLDESLRADLRAAIASVQRATGAPSPLDETQRALSMFRCTGCHERDTRGGVGEALLSYFKCRVETDLGDEGRLPPRLDGVGQRLQSPWLAKAVGEGARARPYLAARMPAFGSDVGASFASGLAALEGEWRSDGARAVSATPAVNAPPIGGAPNPEALAADGRKLAGSGGFNCITCHSFGERPSAGTPGLDFTQMGERLRGEWWRRYALAPMRFKPGTRMPSYFENGKSSVVTILDGDATRQIEALWTWLEQARRMAAPEGVPTGRRMVLDVKERPKVFRTFLARAGNRGIAVGWPEGLHFAFDAEQIRLCEAWSGDFLDVAPVWTGRGGNVAPQLGAVVWSAPPGPALLLEEPAGEWPTDSGRNHGLKFRGYRLEPDGSPTFLWELRPAATPADEPPLPDAVQVEERFVPDPRAEVLFVRTLTVTNVPSGAWIFTAPLGAKETANFSAGRGGLITGPIAAGGAKVRAKEGTTIVVRFEIQP